MGESLFGNVNLSSATTQDVDAGGLRGLACGELTKGDEQEFSWISLDCS